MRATVTATFALYLVAAAGCLQEGQITCADGVVCPAAQVCAPTGRGCADSSQVRACEGKLEDEACTLVGIGDGVCRAGLCQVVGCGDRVVDPDEACDDGNVTSGDGCRADCGKVEACGDGVVDVGEGCDDGPAGLANPADGCDACVVTAWAATARIGGNTQATAVGLAYPQAVALDRAGNLYVADTIACQIRRVDRQTGIASIVAGTGVRGYAGDGGPATSARLGTVYGLAVDGLGSLYLAEAGNNRIRRIDADTGVITTVAGTGVSGHSGDGGPATSAALYSPFDVDVDGLGNLYIADTGNDRIRRVDATTGRIATIAGDGGAGDGGDGGPATSAQLDEPRSVTVTSAGELYVADSYHHRVRKIDAAGVITAVAGSGAAGFAGDGGPALAAQLDEPWGVAVDAADALWITDSSNQRIRRVAASTGVIATVAGTGVRAFGGDGALATLAQLAQPGDVVVDDEGAAFVADTFNQRVRRVDPSSGLIATIAGSGTTGVTGDGGAATSALLAGVRDVELDAAGNVFIAEAQNHRIRRVDAVTGAITTVAGTGAAGFAGDGGLATSALLSTPQGVAVDAAGDLFISDTNNQRVRRVDAVTGLITTIAGTGTGGFSGDGGPGPLAMLDWPSGGEVDAAGNFYFADWQNYRIRRIDAGTGVITTVAGSGVAGPGGDGGPAIAAELTNPVGVTMDAAGNLFIADQSNYRVRRVDATTQVITTVAGDGTYGAGADGGDALATQLASPTGVAVDEQGNVFIAEYNGHRLRRVDAGTGIITTVAGTGGIGVGGDGGAASAALLRYPQDVEVDGLGNLVVADADNGRVRRVDAASGVITTLAGKLDPEGPGPLPQATLADPQALALAPDQVLFAGGSSGGVQAALGDRLEVVAGRYPQPAATADLARFRDVSFGSVDGIDYDPTAALIYVTQASANQVLVITPVEPDDATTWTIATLVGDGTPGFADGPALVARLRRPTGLYLDDAARVLYVADAGNHVIRALDLTTSTVTTVAGTPATLGFFGDGGAAGDALLFEPAAITRCPSGDLFVADTGNHRVRRIAAGSGVITTVLGDGIAASSGEGAPSAAFPVNAPRGLACDVHGNLFVSSTSTVRLVAAGGDGLVDGAGAVSTIYGAPPRTEFPASISSCLTGVAVIDGETTWALDSCAGLLVELRRAPAP